MSNKYLDAQKETEDFDLRIANLGETISGIDDLTIDEERTYDQSVLSPSGHLDEISGYRAEYSFSKNSLTKPNLLNISTILIWSM